MKYHRKPKQEKEEILTKLTYVGNHGEDVKECYYYLDSTPTHSYMKALYKYPQNQYPYQQLVEENKKRSKEDPEFELIDTGTKSVMFERSLFL